MIADGGDAVDAIVATAITLKFSCSQCRTASARMRSRLLEATAWAERVGAWSTESWRPGPGCGVEFRDGGGRGVGVGCAARQVRTVALPSAVRAGDCLRPQRFSGVADCRGAMAEQVPMLASQPGFAQAFLATGGRRGPANCSPSPNTPRRGEDRSHRRRRVLPEENSPRQWRRMMRANGGAMLTSDCCRASGRRINLVEWRLSQLHVHDPPDGHRRARTG